MTEGTQVVVYPRRTQLVVYLRDGPVTIPLTGDEKNDALLERFARRGGRVVSRAGSLLPHAPTDPETAMRDALQEGA